MNLHTLLLTVSISFLLNFAFLHIWSIFSEGITSWWEGGVKGLCGDI
jgi:hypothetical protein